jgi:hypothetical protein
MILHNPLAFNDIAISSSGAPEGPSFAHICG